MSYVANSMCASSIKAIIGTQLNDRLALLTGFASTCIALCV